MANSEDQNFIVSIPTYFYLTDIKDFDNLPIRQLTFHFE